MRFISILLALGFVFTGCGKDGAAGAPGAQGPAGADGTDNKIIASINCSGEITGLTGAAGTALNGVWVWYNASLTNAGDVFAYAGVSSASIQIGSTSFYSSQQNGASTAAVIFTADFATSNGGWWQITLNRSTLVTTAVYTDTTLAGQSPVTMNFVPGACTSHTY